MLKAGLLTGHVPLGIAFSGGSDSTALLILAAQAIGPGNLRAVTINHGLRADAAKEAEAAARLCRSMGVVYTTSVLSLKDGSDIQARARSARYAALGAWAAQNNISAIALGHTQDDVAETFLMRLARGSGVDGLAQMPERFERGGTLFLRPLLNAARADLQALLCARAITWSADPSNDDPRFTRVQMRKAQPDLDALGFTRARLSHTAQWMRAASAVLEQAADTWIAQHAWADHGDAVFPLGALESAFEETAARVLTRALCNISGNPYRPRLSALSALMQSETATTLHGCLAYRHNETLRITREVNAITAAERRWSITGPITKEQHIAPLTQAGLNQIKNWRETALLPRRSLLASPAIWQAETLISAPLARPGTNWSATAQNPLLLAK